MIYTIYNETDLIKVLNEISDRDIITSGNQLINLSNYHIIHRLVTFERCKFVSNVRHISTPTNHKAIFTVTRGAEFEKVEFTGKRVINPTTWQQDGLQTLIKADGASYLCIYEGIYTEANNCAVWLYNCLETHVSKASILQNATRKAKYGFGYGIWQGGWGNGKGQVLTVDKSFFAQNRHCIAGSKEPNHIYVTGSEFAGGTYSQHILDRHGEDQIGGGNYHIVNNMFLATDRFAYDLPLSVPSAEAKIRIEGNRFARPFGLNGRIAGITERDLLAVYKNNSYPV